jgi:hypothetical protein
LKQGILFSTTTGGGDSFGFTKIDDVGIVLKNDSSAVGIQIGDGTSLVKPYSSFIKANVWIQSAGGTGMKLNNAELRYGLINFAVQGPSNGNGVDITGNADDCISGSQFSHFFLACGELASSNCIIPSNPPPSRDVLVKSY